MGKRRKRLGDDEKIVGAALAVGRMAIGAGFWIAPAVAAKALGVKPMNSETLAVSRLAGTRDLILGAWLGAELRDGGRPLAPAVAVMACDAADTLTFALLTAAGMQERKPGLRGLAGAGPATAAGAWLVSRLRS